ncbi:MazG nucleotide pyrophosphohydrolase domain-containing protein [Archaeoglobus profundus]|uniref:MazG nucleotide pyrophosphohydrolase n=1 Tax=Archaeoglobus profundus (strain DSM 5631 / JCM 9629 / NBRC 100127 / Av18) TaxID=572546 RepID=D2RFM2_ARCPA|nr:MazG nucleotide pyrophosphohydrolase domain-containing protein [Archaeoglobus profundus]ADB57097.1 MazG nucleotide pyrophosphohydrolase [Archaeoglobus profundus DSM 5631]
MRIGDFQKLIKELYYERDLKRGKEKTMLWLVEEIGELAEAVRKNDLNSIREEMADVFAWLVSLANLYDVDLESAVKEKYPGRCIKCGRIPCECDER